MPKHDYLYLKNIVGSDHYFNGKRNFDLKDDDDHIKNYVKQRKNLEFSYASFTKRIKERHDRRIYTKLHVDYIKIKFLIQFSYKLEDEFKNEYGLRTVNYSDYNKTVTFAITNRKKFIGNFIENLKSFFSATGNYNTEGYINTIKDFEYVDNDTISLDPQIRTDNSITTIELINPTGIKNIFTTINNDMKDYFKKEGLTVDYILDDRLLQLTNLPSDKAQYLISNYDIILSIRIQSCRKIAISPNKFGDPNYSVGLKITTSDELPVIGVIDTGAIKESPCDEILLEDGVDLYNKDKPNPFYSKSDHGTTVSCLASFGINLYKDFKKYNIEADAKIYTIKILDDQDGKMVGLAELREAIAKAYAKDIKIFNLSVNSNQQKKYNSDISTFGYMLDQLAYDLDILIFISTGNLDIDTVKELVYDSQNAPLKIRKYFSHPYHFFYPDLDDSFFSEMTNLYPPADSRNNMVVGALADNYESDTDCSLSQRKGYPAIYSLKDSIDYNIPINDTKLNKNQKNNKLFKPDIVMPGGDLLEDSSKLQVLGSECKNISYVRNSGTSYATPLAANIAAKIRRKYPNINMQTVKAIIINSCDEVPSSYLDDVMQDKKDTYCARENIDSLNAKQKKLLSSMFNPNIYNHRLTGHGRPNVDKCLTTDENSISFIVENEIDNRSYKAINLNLPEYLYETSRTNIHIKCTLCYKFNPVLGDMIAYNPIHISFNICNCVKNSPDKNAKFYSHKRASYFADSMRIKGQITSWSDDFFPAKNKIFSNVQTFEMNINSEEIKRVEGKISLIIRCVNKDIKGLSAKETGPHPFSLIVNVTENRPKNSLIKENLYDEMRISNTVAAIASAEAIAENQI